MEPKHYKQLFYLFLGLSVLGQLIGNSSAFIGAMLVSAVVSIAAADILRALGK